MCYWRRLSKRSTNDTRAGSKLIGANYTMTTDLDDQQPVMMDELQESSDEPLKHSTTTTTTSTTTTDASLDSGQISSARKRRRSRRMRYDNDDDHDQQRQQTASLLRRESESKQSQLITTDQTKQQQPEKNLSDKISLFQALEVRQEREPDAAPYFSSSHLMDGTPNELGGSSGQMCYRRAEVFAFLFTTVSILLAAISLTIGCCLRVSNLRARARKRLASALSLSSANLCHSPISSTPSSASYASSTSGCSTNSATTSTTSNNITLNSPPIEGRCASGLKGGLQMGSPYPMGLFGPMLTSHKNRHHQHLGY